MKTDWQNVPEEVQVLLIKKLALKILKISLEKNSKLSLVLTNHLDEIVEILSVTMSANTEIRHLYLDSAFEIDEIVKVSKTENEVVH